MKRSLAVLGAFGVTLLMHRLLSLVPLYRELHSAWPSYITESFKNLCEIGVCLAVLLALGERHIARALALDRRIGKALVFGLACSAPMLIGFAIAHRSDVRDPVAVLFLAFLFPFCEEVVARGFAFRTLRRLGWPLWTAVAACAMITGLAHVEKGQTAAEVLALFAFTGAGGATFCWLLDRWQSLWFPFALHALMNFWWSVFNVAPTALGGWYAFVLQIGSIVLAILITLRFTKKLQPIADLSPKGEEKHLPDRHLCGIAVRGNADGDLRLRHVEAHRAV